MRIEQLEAEKASAEAENLRLRATMQEIFSLSASSFDVSPSVGREAARSETLTYVDDSNTQV